MLLCTHVFVSSFCQWLSLAHPDHRLHTYSICHCISGHGLAFEACFKLPATFTWTQAAKASLGRQRHSYSPGPWGTNEQSCFFFFFKSRRKRTVRESCTDHSRKKNLEIICYGSFTEPLFWCSLFLHMYSFKYIPFFFLPDSVVCIVRVWAQSGDTLWSKHWNRWGKIIRAAFSWVNTEGLGLQRMTCISKWLSVKCVCNLMTR